MDDNLRKEKLQKKKKKKKKYLFGDVLVTGPADEREGQQKHISSSIT